MSNAVEAVRAVLALPDDELDYARAKLAFDKIVDPAVDEPSLLAELDRMATAARSMAGAGADDDARLLEVRRVIYKSGPWNDHRPFAYDHEGFKAPRCKLLSNYLETRLGNCVSMPVLFLILAERLGLDVSLSLAPQHLFVKYRPTGGTEINLEPTGTGMPARDAWYRQELPMTDQAVASGYCLRRLSKRESVAAMATSVLEHLSTERRGEDVVALCDLLLPYNPRDALVWVRLGHVCYLMVRDEFLVRYSSPFLIPSHLKPRHDWLTARDHIAFARACALGWRPSAEMAPLYDRFGSFNLSHYEERKSSCS